MTGTSGMIVTASHTAGVYLLGGVTLYASRYILPDRLYPWIGVVSGLTVVAVGLILLLKRSPYHWDSQHHEGHHIHEHQGISHSHADEHPHSTSSRRYDDVRQAVSLRELLALGVTGGIVPCPAALVVLLSALSLNRLGFGVLLIVAFSLGLALMLIAIGLLIVYAQRFMARRLGEGPLVTRWHPLTSSAVIAILGIAMTIQALMTAGIL